MILFITTMLIWWCIYFAHYYLGKRIITGISEEKLIEIMTTPLFYSKQNRTFKKLEKRSILLLLIIYVPIVWIYTMIFKEIQKIILPTEGITFTGGFVVLPAIFVGIGTIIYIIFKITAHQNNIVEYKWKRQPTLKTCRERVAKLKRLGIFGSLFGQFLFVTTMLFYTNIGDKGVTNSGFFDLDSITRSYDDIEKVETSVSIEKVSRDGVASHDYHYFYNIKFNNNKIIELWDPFGWSQKKVKKLKLTTYYFKENDVPIIVNYPSFLNWANYKRILSIDRYQELKNYFDEMRDVSEDITGAVPMTKNITIDSVIYRIDSVTMDSENGIFSALKDKTYLFVHLTAHNESSDSFYISPFDFQIYDQLDSVYRHSIFAHDTFEGKVPSNATQSGSFGFDVPKKIAFPLKLRYKDGFLAERYYWFELKKII